MTVLKHGETAGREVSKRVLAPVADEAALALVSSTDCVDLASIRVGAAWWYYDAASSAAGSSGSVVVPADNPSTGRFLIDNPLGDVPATRTITAGNGLTGGGTLASDRTVAVGAGTGITVNADDVAVTFGLVGEMAAAGVTSANAVGTTDKSARVDHAHAHGAQAIGDGTNHAVASATYAGFMSAAHQVLVDGRRAGLAHDVRGIVTANVADLGAFTVAANDGLTYAEGERVGLVGQSTPAQNGIYVVGVVGGGTAALTRAADWAAAAVLPAGSQLHANEGTLWANSVWFATVAGAITVATTAPAFYPRKQSGTATLGGGTGTATVTTVWLLSTTTSHIAYSVNTVGGTQGLMNCPVASRTAGAGTGQFVLDSDNNADTSTVDWSVFN